MNPSVRRNVTFFERKHFIDIAKIVSNEFIGREADMVVDVPRGRFVIKTNTCDLCPMVEAIHDDNSVLVNVAVNGDYTDGWQPVHPNTLERIFSYLDTNGPVWK